MATGTMKVRAVADMSQLRRAMNRSQGKVQRWSGAMKGVGRTMSKTVTPAIGGMAAMALKTASDFESSMKRVQALTGSTGKEFKGLESLAKDLGRTTQFSASEAAEGMGFLAQAGFETDEIMSALPGTLNLAAAGQLELAEAADIASNVLTGYGLEADEINRVNDVLAKTSTSANTDVRQLGEAFSLVAPVAKSSGLAFEETNAILGSLGDAGIQASRAGTTLRGMLAALESPSKAAAKAMDRLGLKTHDAQGELLPMADIVEQLEDKGLSTADAMEIFGRRAGPGMAALVEKGADGLRKMTGELEESGGTAKEIADKQMEGLRGAMLRLKAALEGVAISIADSGLLDWATGLAEKFANLLGRLAETNPQILKIATVVAVAAAAAGPLLWIVGALVGALGAILSPAALVVAGIGAVTAAFVAAYKGSEEFRDVVNAAVRKVKNVAGPVFEWLQGAVGSVAEWFGLTRRTVIDETREMSNEAVANTVEMVQGITDEVRQLQMDSKAISDKTAEHWIGAARRMRNTVVAEATKQHDETISEFTQLASEMDSITDEQAADAIEDSRRTRDKTIANANQRTTTIENRIRTLRDRGVKITKEQADIIIGEFERQREQTVTALSEQETQATNVLTRLKAESGQISLAMAAEAIKQSARQRDETITNARTEHRDRVAAINQMETESEEFTREMADDAIRESARQRDETITSAETQHSDVVAEIKGMRDGVGEQIDLMTGDFISGFDRMKEDAVAWNLSVGVVASSVIGKFANMAEETGKRLNEMAIAAAVTGSRLVGHLNNHMNTAKVVVKLALDKVVEWFRELPGRIVRALGDLAATIGEKFSFSLAGATFSGTGDGPGFAVPDAGGSAMERARAVMEAVPGRQRITSAYRSPARNAAVGGSPTSYHLDRANPAVDIGGENLNAVFSALERMGGHRELLGPPNDPGGHGDHVHVAHSGGRVTDRGIDPLPGELLVKAQRGETIFPAGTSFGGDGDSTTAVLRRIERRLAEGQTIQVDREVLGEVVREEFRRMDRDNISAGLP